MKKNIYVNQIQSAWDNPEHRQESHFAWGTLFLFLAGLAFGALLIAILSLAFII